MSSAREQMQLPLTKEKDSSEDSRRKTATSTQQESPPKIRESKSVNYSLDITHDFLSAEVPDKENQTIDSEVILRRTQSFENDEK